MNKRAELTSTQLVTIIVLIVSFIVILFLIFRLNPGEQNNKEICHNSVVLKSKTLGTAGPLDCRTNYVCISGRSDCVTKATSTIKVNPDKKNEIMEAIAKEMADCWYMFGEDKKLRYTDEVVSGKTYCAICSIIEFDKKVQEKNKEILYSDFYDYLRITKKDSSRNYLNYLYGVDSLDTLKVQKQFPMIDISSDPIDTKRKYSIITGIDFDPLSSSNDEWLKVYLIPTSETGATSCNEFITKA